MGNAFSLRAKAQTLATRALYARTRNPIYVFGGLAVVGLFLYVNRPEALWSWV
jgi:protein-S-isoprenylcysteine O-methyltransferase Ste14